MARGDQFVLDLLKSIRQPVVIGLNKQDLIAEEQREELIASYSEALPDAPLLPFSALTGDGCSALVEALGERLPEGPMLPQRHGERSAGEPAAG